MTTVSRVLNGKAYAIPESTRERVLKCAADLDYRPNSLAAALRNGHTNTIGLIIPDITDAYFHDIARGVEDVARSVGFKVIFCNTDRVIERELDYVRLLDDSRVDAVIFAGGAIGDDRHLTAYPWRRMKVVTVGPHKLDAPSVKVDDAKAIELAIKHLRDVGCQRVLCLASHPDWLITQERLRGYREGVKRFRLAQTDDLIVQAGFRREEGSRATQKVIADGLEFDAVLCFNDYTALGAIEALQASGRRVPRDVAVMGCDDLMLSSLVTPKLTSIRFPGYQLGDAAAKKALAAITDSEAPSHDVFDFQIKVRESTSQYQSASRSN